MFGTYIEEYNLHSLSYNQMKPGKPSKIASSYDYAPLTFKHSLLHLKKNHSTPPPFSLWVMT